MTQEQKQFIIKALESGIPAIAQEHIRALDELVQIEGSSIEELHGVENFTILNSVIYETMVKTIIASYPFMANTIIQPLVDAVRTCNAKFEEVARLRQEKEAEAEASKVVPENSRKKVEKK